MKTHFDDFCKIKAIQFSISHFSSFFTIASSLCGVHKQSYFTHRSTISVIKGPHKFIAMPTKIKQMLLWITSHFMMNLKLIQKVKSTKFNIIKDIVHENAFNIKTFKTESIFWWYFLFWKIYIDNHLLTVNPRLMMNRDKQ